MNMLLRVLLGAIGVFALFGATQHWFSFDAAFTGRGIAAIDDIGRANLRADVGDCFWELVPSPCSPLSGSIGARLLQLPSF